VAAFIGVLTVRCAAIDDFEPPGNLFGEEHEEATESEKCALTS
jgi:hypothetical protein